MSEGTFASEVTYPRMNFFRVVPSATAEVMAIATNKPVTMVRLTIRRETTGPERFDHGEP